MSFRGLALPVEDEKYLTLYYILEILSTQALGDLCLHYTLNMCVQVCLSALCSDGRLDEVESVVFVVKGVQGSVMTSG